MQRNNSPSTQIPVPGTHLIDVFCQTVRKWCGLHEETVVFVRGLGETHDGRLLADRLAVRDDRVRFLQGDAGVVLLQVLQTDLQMELTSTWGGEGLDFSETFLVLHTCMHAHTPHPPTPHSPTPHTHTHSHTHLPLRHIPLTHTHRSLTYPHSLPPSLTYQPQCAPLLSSMEH